MAVAYEASSASSAATNPGTSVTSFNWSHGGTAPKAVVVFVFEDSDTDYISGVTYGGRAMTDLGSSYRSVDSATEPGSVKTYFLNGETIPTGSQSVVVSCTSNGTEKWAVAVSFTGAAGKALLNTGVVTQTGDGALAVVAVTDGSPGSNSVRIAAAYYGGAAVAPAGTGSTLRQSLDSGNYGYSVVTETTAGQGSRNVGFNNATSDDRATVHFAVAELANATARTATDTGMSFSDGGITALRVKGRTLTDYAFSTFEYVSQIGTDGTGNDQFTQPRGIATDGTNLYVADNANHRIFKRLASDLSYISKIGTSGSGNDQFSTPDGICTDSTHVYVIDMFNNRIHKRLCSDLSYVSQIGTAGSGNDQFITPVGICTDGTYLYVGDSGNHRIVKRLASDLSYVTKIGTLGTGNDNFNAPSDITTDGTYVYVVDLGNSRIVKRLASDLSYVSQVGTSGSGNDQFSTPCGITVSGGYLYIIDKLNYRVVKRSASDLSYVAQFGTNGTGNDQFDQPNRIVSNGTYVWITDGLNDRIVKRLAATFSDSLVALHTPVSGANYSRNLYDAGIAAGPFPSTPVLDTGVRADEGPPPSSSWNANGTNTTNQLRITSNAIANNSGQSGAWGTQFGPDCEIYLTVATLPPDTAQIQLHLRLQQIGAATVDGYRLQFARQDSYPGYNVQYYRLDDNAATLLGASIDDSSGAISTGIKIGFRVIAGVLTAYINKSGTWETLSTRSDSTYTDAGYIALRATSATAYTDFGGGTPIGGSDTLVSLKTASRTLSDTGFTFSETLVTRRSRLLNDKGITPGGTSLRAINFDLGDAGTNITTSDPGSPDAFNAQSATPPVRSTAQKYSGVHSMLYSGITASQTSVFTGLGTLTGNVWTRMYLYLPSLPADNNYYPINFRSAADGSSAILRILSSGIIQMRDASNSQIGSDGSVAVATGQWVRIEVRVLPGTGGTGQMEYWLYNSADSTTVTDTGSATGATLAANTDRIAFGSAIAGVAAGITFYMDDVEVSTAGKIGPLGTNYDSLSSNKILAGVSYSWPISDTGSTVTESLKLTNLNRSLTDLGVALVEAGWRAKTTVFSTTGINGIARSENDDMWVAVADSGKLATSTDRGITWTLQTSSFSTTAINAVARSDSEDLWVAVGDTGKLATSSDGTTWTQQTSGFSTTGILDVAYSASEDLWIAVGNSGKYSTSPDGTTWTAQTPLFSGDPIQGIARSDTADMWVAVGSNGNLATSTNGTSWQVQSSAFSVNIIYSIAYSERLGMWVATGQAGNVASSFDGTIWTSRTSGFGSSAVFDVAYSETTGVWAIVGSGGKLSTSVDGISWTLRASPDFSTTQINGIEYSPARDTWIIVGGTGKISGTLAESLVSKRTRPLTDTGSTISESLVILVRRVRTLTDTGSTITESLATRRSHALRDSGMYGTPQSAVLEPFTGSGALSGSWTAPAFTGDSTPVRFSDVCTTAISTYGSALYNAATYGVDQEAFITSPAVATGAVRVILWTKIKNPNTGSATNYTGYFFLDLDALSIVRQYNGSDTEIVAETPMTLTTTDKFMLKQTVVGDDIVINVFIDSGDGWALRYSHTDVGAVSTYPLLASTGGNIGFGFWGDGATEPTRSVDDFGGGSIVTDSLVSYKRKSITLADDGLTQRVPIVSVVEDFNRADGAAGANWQPRIGSGTTPVISSNEASDGWDSYWVPLSNTILNQESFATWTHNGGFNAIQGWHNYRIQNPGATEDCYEVDWGGSFFRVIGGSYTNIGSFGVPAFSVGDKYGGRVYGSGTTVTIEAWKYVASTGTWTLLGSTTDTDGSRIVAPGYFGWGTSDVGSRYDNFAAGEATLFDSLVRVYTPSSGGSYSWPISDTGVTQTDSLVKLAVLSRTLSDTGVTNTDSLLTRREHVLTDTGLTQTDSLVKLTSNIRAISDTGSTITESLATRRNHLLTDTGLTQTDSLVKTQWLHFAITDTGVTNTDTIVDLRLRALSDNGVVQSDSLVATRRLSITISDTGVTQTDELIKGRYLFISDTGVTQTDSLVAQRRLSFTLSDTGLTQTDTLVDTRIRSISDTGVTNTDSLRSLRNHVLTDTGITLTDVLAERISLNLTDTGVTNTDTLVRLLIAARSISDTGLTQTDSLVTYKARSVSLTDQGTTFSETLVSLRQFYRVNTDTGLTQTDSLVKLARTTRSATDTGVTQTDSLVTLRNRPLTDTLTQTDSLVTRRNHVLTDTALTQTDSVNVSSGLNISVSDTGVTHTDSLARLVWLHFTISDTGVTQTDTLVDLRTRVLSDTGVTQTDTIVDLRYRSLTDTGVTLTDVLAERISHNLTDTGLTQTDSLVRRLVAFRTASDTGVTNTDSLVKSATRPRTISDTGLTQTDTLRSARTHVLTDTGLTQTDSVNVTSGLSVSISDTGITQTDSLVATRKFFKTISDTGLTQTDSLSAQRSRTRTNIDTGLTQTDALASRRNRVLSDTGLTLVDVLAERINHYLTTTGLTQTDSLVAEFETGSQSYSWPLTDTGITSTDSLSRQASRTRSISTTLTFSDTLAARRAWFRTNTDTGLTLADTLDERINLYISDTVLTLTDSISVHREYYRFISTQGVFHSDVIPPINVVRTNLVTGEMYRRYVGPRGVYRAYYVREWYRRWKG